MLVPAAVEDLHEADAALDQPAGQQRSCGERARLVDVGAVQVEDVLAARSRGRSARGRDVCIRKAISYSNT